MTSMEMVHVIVSGVIQMPEGFGWRGRVGMIMPATQTVTEPLYYSVAPPGVSFHTSRMAVTGVGPAAIAETENQVERAVLELKQAQVQCIAYLCVTAGLTRGLDGEREFCEDIEARHGIPVVSALLSTMDALARFDIKKIVITGPYPDGHNILEQKLFSDNGFEVLGVHGLGITDGFGFGQVPPSQILEFCRRHWDSAADGLFVACAAFNVMPVIEVMEHEFGVPVVTAHAAVLWQVFERLGIKEPLEGYGRLLRREYQPAGHRA